MKAIDKAARDVSQASGSAAAALSSIILIAAWCVGGLFFGFGEEYQLIINSSTTVITFVMVFFIQNAQNRDTAAIQAKLDEIIAATSGARNELVGIEKNLSEDEIEDKRKAKDEC